jgi:hypothetical protein
MPSRPGSIPLMQSVLVALLRVRSGRSRSLPWLCAAGCVLWPGVAPVAADGVRDCLKMEAKPGATAVLVNVCSQRLNVMYCIQSAQSRRSCAGKPTDVTTLFPAASTGLADYDGAPVHWAVCIYPEAPVAWDHGPDHAYACKKTCVMC